MKKKFKDFLNGQPCRLYYVTSNKITPFLGLVITDNECRNRGYYANFYGTGIIRLSESKKNPMRQVEISSGMGQFGLNADDLEKSVVIEQWWGKEHGRIYCNVEDACPYVIEELKKTKQNINKKIFEYQKLMNTVEA